MLGRMGARGGFGGMGTGLSAAHSFTPASLAGLQLWLKADTGTFTDAGVTPALNGQAIQQINDLSGKNNHVTNAGTSTTRPTLDTTGFGTGKPGIKFIAANSQFISRASIAFNSAPATLIVFVKPTNASVASGRIFSFIGQGQSDDFGNAASFCLGMTGGATATAFSFDNGAFQTNGGAAFPVTLGSDNAIALVFNGSQANSYVNGAVQGAATTFSGTLGATTAAIGFGVRANGAAGEFFDGELAEALLYSSALSAAQITQLETYFQGRYGPF